MAMDKESVWVLFAASACTTAKTPEDVLYAAAIADRMLHQWSARFGDAAFLLAGQEACAACHTPIEAGDEYMPSIDGLKFCNIECLKASGREE
jgi:hypothetical protein